MKKLSSWLVTHKWSAVLVLIGAALSLALLLLRLDSITRGLSAPELALQPHYMNLSAIVHNPVYLPLLFVHWLVGLWAPLNVFWVRIPNVLFAAATLAMAAYVLRRWYGPRTATFGFLVFACSAWLLHVGRIADVSVMYAWLLPTLFFANLVLHNHTDSALAAAFWVCVQVTLLYIPGGLWFVIINAILQRHELIESYSAIRSWLIKLGIIAISLVLLSPLIVGLLIGNTRALGLSLLGLPMHLPILVDIGNNAKDSLLFITIRGNTSDALWLNHLPIFDAFLTIVMLAGIYFYAKHWRANRALLLMGCTIMGLLLVISGGPVTIGVLVPLFLLVIAAGIAFLLHLWLVVFPRNPLARGVGIGLIAIAVTMSCVYNLRQYFVAWPHHQATQAAFAHHEITRPQL